MAENVLAGIQVQLTADTTPFAQSMDKAAAKAKSSAREISSSLKKEMAESKGSLMLLGETVGVAIPRHLQTFISTLPGVSKAMSAAFDAVAVIAIIGVLVEAGKKVEELARAYEKAKDKAAGMYQSFDKVLQPIQASNDALIVTNDKLQGALDKLEHKPHNGMKEALDEAVVVADDLLKKVSDAYEKIGEVISKNEIGSLRSFFTGESTNKDLADLYYKHEGDVVGATNDYRRETRDATTPAQKDAAQTKLTEALAGFKAGYLSELTNRFNAGKAQYNAQGLLIKPEDSHRQALLGLMKESELDAQQIPTGELKHASLQGAVDTQQAKKDAADLAAKVAEAANKAQKPGDLISETLANLHEQLAAQKAIEAVSKEDAETRAKAAAVNKANLDILKLGEQLAKMPDKTGKVMNTAGWTPAQFSAMVPGSDQARIHSAENSIQQSSETSKLNELMEKSQRESDLNTTQMLRLTTAMTRSYFEVQRANALTAAENELRAAGINPSTHPQEVQTLASQILTVNDNAGIIRSQEITKQSEQAAYWTSMIAAAAGQGSPYTDLRKFDSEKAAIGNNNKLSPAEQLAELVDLRRAFLAKIPNRLLEESGTKLNTTRDATANLEGQRAELNDPAYRAYVDGTADRFKQGIEEFTKQLPYLTSHASQDAKALLDSTLPHSDPRYSVLKDNADGSAMALEEALGAITNLKYMLPKVQPHSNQEWDAATANVGKELGIASDKQLMDTQQASAGFKVFFDEFTREADDAATAVKSALTTAMNGVNDALTEAMMGKNKSANWSKAFEQTGSNMIHSGLKMGESQIMKALGLGKPDGSASKPFYIRFADALGMAGGSGPGTVATGGFSGSPLSHLLSSIPLIGRLFGGAAPEVQAGMGMPFAPMGYAEGGNPDPYGTSIVGENGPELFTPHGVSGTVTPNKSLKGLMGGGGSVQQNFNIDATGTNAAEVNMRVRQGSLAAYKQAMSDSPRAQQERSRRVPSSRSRG